MPLVIDDSVPQHVTVRLKARAVSLSALALTPVLQRVRDGSLEWFIAEYEGKEKIKVTNSGSGNFDEFKVARRTRPPRQPASSYFPGLSV